MINMSQYTYKQKRSAFDNSFFNDADIFWNNLLNLPKFMEFALMCDPELLVLYFFLLDFFLFYFILTFYF